jgi:hypothetical protein
MRALLVLLVAAVTTSEAQTLASRVAAAPDGDVRMEFASRPGTCGDGRDIVGYRNALFSRNFQTFGHWSGVRCVAGPLRVTLVKSDRQVWAVRTQVGGSWDRVNTPVTDLGVVSPSEAAAYVFTLVPRLESASKKDRLLLPAVLAEDAPVLEPLLKIARDEARGTYLRQHAVTWLGLLGDMSVVQPLMEMARNERGTDKSVEGSALFALSVLEGDAGVRAASWLIERAQDERENTELRKNALFWSGQRDETPTALLVRVYREARPTSLREHAIFVLSQRRDNEAIEALLNIAREEKDKDLRGKALFWLAQKDDVRVRQLIADLILKEP